MPSPCNHAILAAMAARKTVKQVPVREIQRIQTGVRLEKRLLKVLKGLAEYLDLSLADLLEGMALHSLENKPPFKAATLDKVMQLRKVYGLDLTAADSHRLREEGESGKPVS
jgi:hypothetical protein